MTISKLPRYIRDVKKLIKSHKLTQNEIDATEKLFHADPYHKSLRYHQITCKKDKSRWSITIPNTQYRILITNLGKVVQFNTLLDHKSYDRINKNC